MGGTSTCCSVFCSRNRLCNRVLKSVAHTDGCKAGADEHTTYFFTSFWECLSFNFAQRPPETRGKLETYFLQAVCRTREGFNWQSLGFSTNNFLFYPSVQEKVDRSSMLLWCHIARLALKNLMWAPSTQDTEGLVFCNGEGMRTSHLRRKV